MSLIISYLIIVTHWEVESKPPTYQRPYGLPGVLCKRLLGGGGGGGIAPGPNVETLPHISISSGLLKEPPESTLSVLLDKLANGSDGSSYDAYGLGDPNGSYGSDDTSGELSGVVCGEYA